MWLLDLSRNFWGEMVMVIFSKSCSLYIVMCINRWSDASRLSLSSRKWDIHFVCEDYISFIRATTKGRWRRDALEPSLSSSKWDIRVVCDDHHFVVQQRRVDNDVMHWNLRYRHANEIYTSCVTTIISSCNNEG